MGYNYFPNDIIDLNLKSFFNFNNHSLVQFYHRSLAYITIVYFLILSFYIYQMNLRNLFKPIKLVFIFLFLQIILGILTLISGLNIYLASAHQINSVILVFSAINLYYFQTN